MKTTQTQTFKQKLIIGLSKLYPMAKRALYRFHGGVFPRYNKELSLSHPLVTDFIPKTLVLPLQQHVGVSTEPLIKPGDHVLKNQLLANTEKGLAAPIHAPTSGKIIAIEPRTLPHASGLSGLSIVLESDQKDQVIENSLEVDGSTPDTPDKLKALIHKAGIVGMGGAGFPTFAKIPSQAGQIKYLLINGAECEPFITCDDMLMQTRAEEIVQGAIIVAQSLGIKHILCGIEDNKAKAIKAMQKAANNTPVHIKVVATAYPMGGQTQLTQELTGIELPAHTHAIDVGVLMMNVATFAAIYQAIIHGNPLTSRYITVSGLGLNKPFNIDARLGTSFKELALLADPKTPLEYPLIKGGPMMGIEMQSNDVPVIKTTNCILATPPEPMEEPMPCIRCGECMDACPINLLPQQLYWHSRSHEFDKVESLKVFDCIECGCCSFVCPSHIPLVQYYRFAKSEIKHIKQEEATAELAKKRHEFRQERLEREKREREARIRAKKEAVKQKAAQQSSGENTETDKPKTSAAAAARAAKARAAKTGKETTDSVEPKLSARDKAIAAAKKRAEAANKTSSSKASEPTEKKSNTKPKDPKAAAMAAAKKRAAQKAQEKQSSNTNVDEKIQTDTVKDKRATAVEAARQKVAEKKQIKQTEQSESDVSKMSSDTSTPTDETKTTTDKSSDTKRKAAMAAAKARAKKQQSKTTTEKE